MHDFQFQRFMDSSLPLPTQEGIAAKRARTHGEWHCSVACIQDIIGFSCCQYFSVSMETRGGVGRSVYLLSSLNRQVITEYTSTKKHLEALSSLRAQSEQIVYYIILSLRDMEECGCSSIWFLSVPTGTTPHE